MRNEYILLIKNGEVKFSNRIVPNHDKKRVQELVQEFCNLIRYEFTSDEQYAKDFYFKAYFLETLEINVLKMVLILILRRILYLCLYVSAEFYLKKILMSIIKRGLRIML